MTQPIQHVIEERPDFALLRVTLAAGQAINAEPAAMATMDPWIELKAGLKGGLLKSMGRALGGESMIVNTFTSRGKPGEVTLAPGPMGDMVHYRLEQGRTLIMQRGGYVASSPTVEISGKWGGAKGFFSGEGLVLLKATGQGDLFFGTFGAILEVDVRGGYVVDTGYIVAFEDTLQYRVSTLPGLSTGGKLKSILGGDALVCHFEGEGKLWIQTRATRPFLNFVERFRPVKKRN